MAVSFAPEIGVGGIGGTGNWISAVERIKSEFHRERSAEEDQIKRALISAIEHYKWHRLWFNEGSSSMFTQPGVAEYGPESTAGLGNGWPLDMLQIDEAFVFQNAVEAPIQHGSAETGSIEVNLNFDPGQGYIMNRTSYDTLRIWIDAESSTGSHPLYYGWHHDRLFVFPIPDDTYKITFHYLRDLPHPKYQFVGGEWNYFDSIKNRPIDDTYSTPWLVHAEELIRSRAQADLWGRVFYKPQQAQVARAMEQDAFRDLARGTEKKLSTGQIRPSFGGAFRNRRRY